MTSISSVSDGFSLATSNPLDAKTLSDAAPDGIDSITWNLSSPTERADLMRSYAASDYDDVVIIAPDEPIDGGGSVGGDGGDGGGSVGGVGGGSGNSATRLAAQRISVAGGTADQNDLAIVRAEMAKLPYSAIAALEKAGIVVVVARGNAADAAPHLANQQPGGWALGTTFSQVPGAYDPVKKQIIIAVTGHGTAEGARVPKKGEGHGSENLILHEMTHAIDAIQKPDRNSTSVSFIEAYNADKAALPSYEQADYPINKGLSEAYAESAARYYGGSHGGISTPALDAFWAANPIGQ